MRDLRELTHKETAAQAIAGLNFENEIYGFTKGQFSLLDLLEACLDITGPTSLQISTWTAARHEIQKLADLQKRGRLLSVRWLIDFTFARRDPEAAHQIRQSFGIETIRVARCHAKFALFGNERWRLVLRSSMNLNMNPRTEDFTLANDPELYAFIGNILDRVWARQSRSLADATCRQILDFFENDFHE